MAMDITEPHMYVHSNQLIVTQRSYDTTLVSRND